MTPARIAARLAALSVRKGGPIVLRLTSKSTSPPYAPNPPTLVNPVIDAAASNPPGAISIRADAAMGRLLAGDQFLIAGVVWTLVTPATSRPPVLTLGPYTGMSPTSGFDGLLLSALPAVAGAPTAPDGTAVLPIFQNDYPMTVPVMAFPLRLVDGERIEARDLQVLVPAVASRDGPTLPRAPDVTDLVRFNGNWLTVVSVTPGIVRGVTVSYRLQAR